jgi:hypothetical protein
MRVAALVVMARASGAGRSGGEPDLGTSARERAIWYSGERQRGREERKKKGVEVEEGRRRRWTRGEGVQRIGIPDAVGSSRRQVSKAQRGPQGSSLRQPGANCQAGHDTTNWLESLGKRPVQVGSDCNPGR